MWPARGRRAGARGSGPDASAARGAHESADASRSTAAGGKPRRCASITPPARRSTRRYGQPPGAGAAGDLPGDPPPLGCPGASPARLGTRRPPRRHRSAPCWRHGSSPSSARGSAARRRRPTRRRRPSICRSASAVRASTPEASRASGSGSPSRMESARCTTSCTRSTRRDFSPGPAHRSLAALPPLLRARGLPCPLLLTSGFDRMLEHALSEAGEPYDVVSFVALGRDRGKFLHVGADGSARVIDEPNLEVGLACPESAR